MKKEDYIEFIANHDSTPFSKYESIKKTYSRFPKDELTDHYNQRVKKLSDEQIRFYQTLKSEIFRPAVDLENPILSPLIGNIEKRHKRSLTQSDYVKQIESFERKTEENLKNTFSRLGILATVKTDPYSLPYTNEIVVSLGGESYLNGAYETYRVAKHIVKEILNENLDQFRFYMFINVMTPKERSLFNPYGKIEYRFRYYIRKS